MNVYEFDANTICDDEIENITIKIGWFELKEQSTNQNILVYVQLSFWGHKFFNKGRHLHIAGSYLDRSG